MGHKLWNNRILRVAIPSVFWLGVWQFAAYQVGSALLLPGPMAVAERLFALGGTGLFWQTALLSLGRILMGFVGGAVLGAALAALTAAFSWADMLFSPAVRVVRAVPVASFILLLMLWLSTGLVPGVCAGLMVLPVVWGNVSKGLAETDPLLLEGAAAWRFGPWKRARLIYLPSALPYFASGCATGLGLAWKAGIAAEVLSLPRQAIGLEIRNAKLYVETPDLFAWTVVVILLSFLLENVLAVLFRQMERGRRG